MSLEATIRAAREYLDPQKVDCVIYHHPCNDGSGAALSAWLVHGEDITYLQRDYTQPFNEELLRHKNVVVLDASFKKDQLHSCREIAKRVLILDHHDSAQKELRGEPGCCFSMANSGAILAWHYFNGVETPAPKLLELIEDRDLWRWNARALSEPLFYALIDRHLDADFRKYAQYLDEEKLNELIEYGQSLKTANDLWCAEAAVRAEQRTFTLPGSGATYTVMCLELESDKLVSELAEYLYSRHNVDFTMFWYPLAHDHYKISFRSNQSHINVGDIASALGGGGHPAAAGATVQGSPWDMVK